MQLDSSISSTKFQKVIQLQKELKMTRNVATSALIGAIAIGLAGCSGTHAQIDSAIVKPVDHENWKGKVFAYEVYYAQPEPGVFTSSEEKMPMKPLEEATLSIGAATALSTLDSYLFKQLPTGTVRHEQGPYDYKIVLELIAHSKLGPAYADFQAGASLVSSLVTLGFSASEYMLTADYDLTCKILNQSDTQLFAESFKVHDEIEHSKGDLESHSINSELVTQLLQKHLVSNINSCLSHAAQAYNAKQHS